MFHHKNKGPFKVRKHKWENGILNTSDTMIDTYEEVISYVSKHPAGSLIKVYNTEEVIIYTTYIDIEQDIYYT